MSSCSSLSFPWKPIGTVVRAQLDGPCVRGVFSTRLAKPVCLPLGTAGMALVLRIQEVEKAGRGPGL
eukprot:7513885-Heterocapsa_arctica.AAC.1